MSDKPSTSTLPRWATDGAAKVATPASGKQDIGWDTQEKPPAQWWNWLCLNAYLWLLWISDGYWTRPSLTDNTPVLATTDRAGRERHYLGPEGYWMGPAIQETHRWGPVDVAATVSTGGSVSPLGMKAVVDANTSISIISGLSGSVTSGEPSLSLAATTLASNQRAMVLSEYGGGTPGGNQPVSDLDNNVVVMEHRSYVSSATLTGIEYYSGIHNFASFGATTLALATNRFAYFLGATGSANWRCYVANGSSTSNVDSGVAIVADQMYTFLLELHGANSPVGVDAGGAVARFFIDGAEVAEITTANVPSGLSSLGGFHAVAGSSPASDRYYRVHTTKLAWSAVLSPDVPA